MAIIYSYPEATIESTDFLLGTKINESGHPTKSFLVSDLITLVQSNIPTPTLNEVLTAGNTSQIDANVGIMGVYDITNSNYSYMTGDRNRINFYSDLSTRLGYFGDNTIVFDNNNFIISIKGPDTLSANRTIKFPDDTGTVALISNLQALDLQDVVDVNNTTTTGVVINTATGVALTASTAQLGENAIEGTGGQYGAGVYGTNPVSGTGVSGYAPLGTGVAGGGAIGVNGTTSTGTAIYASASTSGVGVLAASVSGIAINVLQGGVSISGSTGSVGYQLKLSSDSAAKPSTNTWTIASDSRIKENINPYTKGLETIMAINPITYDYNGLAGFEPTKGNIGIIAQDLISVLPESIKTYHTLLNENDEEQTELYTFDSHALTFVLINAIKELKAEIEILKAK